MIFMYPFLESQSIEVEKGYSGWVPLGVAGTPSQEALDNLMAPHLVGLYWK